MLVIIKIFFFPFGVQVYATSCFAAFALWFLIPELTDEPSKYPKNTTRGGGNAVSFALFSLIICLSDLQNCRGTPLILQAGRQRLYWTFCLVKPAQHSKALTVWRPRKRWNFAKNDIFTRASACRLEIILVIFCNIIEKRLVFLLKMCYHYMWRIMRQPEFDCRRQ